VEREGSKMRRRLGIVAVIGATLAALAAGGIGVLSASAQQKETVDICHRTDAPNNPYITNHPAKSGDVDGHADHTGPIVTTEAEAQAIKDAGQMWGDIIPPFDFDGQHFPGLNATPEGLAILANDCKLVTPTPATTAAPPETAAPPTTAAPRVVPQAPAAPAPPVVRAAPRVTG
jgi:hypothetical protein